MSEQVICKCGCSDFTESRQTDGYWKCSMDGWKCSMDGYGEVYDTNLDNVVKGEIPKTVICSSCGKRNKNPRYAPTLN